MIDQKYRELLFRVFENINEGIYLLDRSRTITYLNGGAERITGYSTDEVAGKKCSDNILNHIDNSGKLLCGDECPLLSVMKTAQEEKVFVYLHSKDGARIPVKVRAIPIKDDKGEVEGILEIFSDRSEVRMAQRNIDKLHEELYLDSLTKVGNRRFCDSELERHFKEYEISGISFAVVLCDIDDFKAVNDIHGHDFGDKVLAMVAKTLTHGIREGDVVSRWGGEEFMLILPGIRDGEELFSLIERVRILVRESFLTEADEQVGVTASFGATISGRKDDSQTLFSRVDKLLYGSKSQGKNRVSIG